MRVYDFARLRFWLALLVVSAVALAFGHLSESAASFAVLCFAGSAFLGGLELIESRLFPERRPFAETLDEVF